MLFLKKLSKFSKINILYVSQLFFGLGIFLLPFRIRSLLYFKDSYSLGFFNEYLAFFVHVSEIFFLLAFFLLGISFFFKKIEFKKISPKLLLPFFVLLTVSVVEIPFSVNPLLSLFHFFRMLEFAFIAFFIASGVFDSRAVLRILIASIFFQAALAVAQFVAKGELGFHFFGESFFTVETFNVAKTILPSGEVIIRGMGMLPHANILGGISVIVLLLFASLPRKNSLAYFVAVVILAGMFFSFSRAALLAFSIGLVVLLIFQFRRRIISAFAAITILVILFASFGSPFLIRTQSDSGVSSRSIQILQSFEIAKENFFGVGKGNYTLTLAEQFPEFKFYQFQPVHNFFALKIVEESIVVGLAWLSIFVLLAWYCFSEKKFEALALLSAAFFLANFDHYFSTNFTAEAILWLLFAFVVGELSVEEPEFKQKMINKF